MSVDPFKRLGVDEEADEREVKRAYARLLKQTRPDEDPVGFQRLNEAYQAALSYCRHRAMALEGGEDEEPAGRGEGGAGTAPAPDREPIPAAAAPGEPLADASPPSPPSRTPRPTVAVPVHVHADDAPRPAPVDAQALAGEVLEHAARDMPSALREWLARHGDLYLLGLKQRVGQAVFERIAYEDARVRPANLPALADFFSIAPPDWVERRLQVRRAVESNDTAAFDEDRAIAIRQLKRPFAWPRALLLACFPGLAHRIARLSDRLASEYGDDVPGLDAGQQRFFAQIANPYYHGGWRWATVLLTALLGAAVTAAVGLFGGADAERVTRVAGYGFVATAVLLCGWHLMRLLWAQRTVPVARQRTGVALLPAGLAVLGLLASVAMPAAPLAGYLLAAPVALIHFQRFFDALRFGLSLIWLFTLLPDGLARPQAGVAGLAGAAIGITVCDLLFAQRHGISPAAAVGNRWTHTASYVAFALSLVVALVLPLVLRG